MDLLELVIFGMAPTSAILRHHIRGAETCKWVSELEQGEVRDAWRAQL